MGSKGSDVVRGAGDSNLADVEGIDGWILTRCWIAGEEREGALNEDTGSREEQRKQ